MKQIISFFLAIALLAACNQPESKKQNGNTTEPAKTTKTASHVKIPNSHIYIIPPSGFKVNEISSSVGKGEAYAHFGMMKIISGTTPEKFFSELKAEADKNFPGSWKQEDIIADGHKATIYQYKNGGVLQHYLAFTDGNTDEMIIANFEESEAATGKEMYEALKTVVVAEK